MTKMALSTELHNAIVWLERQPGVTSVVQARYVRTRHQHPAGFSRVVKVDERHMHVRVFDAKGSKDLFVYAPPSQKRDSMVAAMTAGNAVAASRAEEKPKPQPVATSAAVIPHTSAVVPSAVAAENAAQWYDVTSELATFWLERNTRNRALRQSVVNKYAADMRAGRWMPSPDAVAFDTNNAIIEGQHRLWAVIESGVTVRMLVVFGLAPETINVLGDHLRRNLQDITKIRRPGMHVSTLYAAITNMLIQTSIIANSVDRTRARENVTRAVQIEMMDRHVTAIEFTVRDAFRSATMRSITVAAVMTPVTRAYYTQDRERLRQFGKAMLSGMVEAPEDQAAIMLRNVLLRAQQGNARPVGEIVYRKAERALQAFLEREKIATLYEASGELFPLPEDRPPTKGR